MYKILLLMTLLLFSGCNGEDIDKATNETQKIIDKYKYNDKPHVIEDDEVSKTPDDRDIESMLTLQNSARHDVGISSEYDLKWSDALTIAAQKYADILAESGEFRHDPSNREKEYGENLYASSSSKTTFTQATQAWIAEKSNYNGDKISGDWSECSGGDCGHYTQIVWKNTTKIGCAISRYKVGDKKGWYVVVCKYQTPGNIIGLYPY